MNSASIAASTRGSVTASAIAGRYPRVSVTLSGTMVPDGANPHRVIHRLALLLAPLLLASAIATPALAQSPSPGPYRVTWATYLSIVSPVTDLMITALGDGTLPGEAQRLAVLYMDTLQLVTPEPCYSLAYEADWRVAGTLYIFGEVPDAEKPSMAPAFNRALADATAALALVDC